MRLQKDRLIAAAVVLAGLAQTNPKNTFVQRAIAAIRTWLRENVPSLFRHMEMTDAEIINNYLIPAREFVQRGRKSESAPGGLAGAFSRGSDIHAVNARVNRQIEQWAKGQLRKEVGLQLGEPNEILRLFDIPNLPIRLTQGILRKG